MIRKISLLFFIIIFTCCSKTSSALNSEPTGYQIVYLDTLSFVGANSCYEYLSTNGTNKFVSISSKSNYKQNDSFISVFFNVNPSLNSDVTFQVNNNNSITLTAKDSKSLIWLGFQFLKKQTLVDSKINSVGLPTAIMQFEKLKDFSFSFQYREPFFQPNLKEENNYKLGTHNLENDWAIWGHNVSRLFTKNAPKDCFSFVEGKRNQDQYCFSSESTFKLISNFINNNFGGGSSVKTNNFTIAPNDNELVCNCDKCNALGNTTINAAPAVLYLIEKLANKYPNHNFFTIDYSSVSTFKRSKLPKNTGVFISSINFKMNPRFHEFESKELVDFESKIKNWKTVTDKIYVWDYSVNFDDYLTPFPNLLYSQKQFQYYNKLGVSGIFCNGSGYDYSIFQDVKTFVLASLLINPYLEVETLINDFYSQYYPVTGKKIAAYILNLENTFINSNKALNIYGSIDDAFNNYLNAKDLNAFCNYLNLNQNTKSSYEKENLKKIITSLCFTQLQKGLYFKKDDENGYLSNKYSINPDFLANYNSLKASYVKSGITSFNERNGKIETYLYEIDKYILSQQSVDNILINSTLSFKSKLDEGYTDVSVLTDGVFGLPIDYHLNWMFVTTDDMLFELPSIKPNVNYTLKCSFLCDKKLKLYPPSNISIFEGSKLLASKSIDFAFTEPNKYLLQINLKPLKGQNLEVKITRNNEFSKIACDEISLQ